MALVLILAGCADQSMSNHVIAHNDEFSVTGDSVICGDVVVWAASPQQITGGLNLNTAEQLLQHLAGSDTVPYCLTVGSDARLAEFDEYPHYQSQQMLVDALYNLSIGDIAADYSSNGGFNSHGDHASLNSAIYLTLAMISPQRAMSALRNQVSNRYVMQQQGLWPVRDDRLTWPIAAWEVYSVTGNREWLAEAYEVSLNTIDEELEIMFERRDGLLRGGPAARYAWGTFYPDWAEASDVAQIETLVNNVMAVRAMEVANDMAEELDTELPFNTEIARLREAVNRLFWNESDGRYCAYLMGQVQRTPAPLADNMAQALAVMWDLADDDRSTTLVNKTPITHRGVLPVHPDNHCIEPHLEYPTWALTQACWNIAAATTGNEHALRRGLAALYRAQALYQPQHVSIEGRPVNSLASAAGNVAMVMRVFAGMRFMPDGIEFNPTVPACLPGNKTILNFIYRDAIIDITLVGTGNDIQLMTLDGEPIEGNYIPGDIQGHHNLLIKLKQGKTESQHVTLASGTTLPPTPAVRWIADSAQVTAWDTGVAYKLTINGKPSYSISDSVFKLPPMSQLAELALVTNNRYGRSLPSRSLLVGTAPNIRVALADSTLANDTLRLPVRVDHAGTYLLSAQYAITNGCDIIQVDANGHPQGAFFAVVTSNRPEVAGISTHLIAVQLLRGDNIITLRRYPIGYRATIASLTLMRQ